MMAGNVISKFVQVVSEEEEEEPYLIKCTKYDAYLLPVP